MACARVYKKYVVVSGSHRKPSNLYEAGFTLDGANLGDVMSSISALRGVSRFSPPLDIAPQPIAERRHFGSL